jgi:hypothetical protein
MILKLRTTKRLKILQLKRRKNKNSHMTKLKLKRMTLPKVQKNLQVKQ